MISDVLPLQAEKVESIMEKVKLKENQIDNELIFLSRKKAEELGYNPIIFYF